MSWHRDDEIFGKTDFSYQTTVVSCFGALLVLVYGRILSLLVYAVEHGLRSIEKELNSARRVLGLSFNLKSAQLVHPHQTRAV